MSRLFDFKYVKKAPVPSEEKAELPERDEPIEHDTAGQTETFFTRNVRLITFLICIAVFLAIFGPISVFRIMDYVEEHADHGRAMQIEDVLNLASQRGSLTLSALEEYEKEADTEHYDIFTVSPHFLVTVSSEGERTRLLCFTVTNTETGEEFDVLAANFSQDALVAFLGR